MNRKLRLRLRQRMAAGAVVAAVCLGSAGFAGAAGPIDNQTPKLIPVEQTVANGDQVHQPEMPDGGPRAIPGRLSVLVYMDPTLGTRSLQRANVRTFAAEKGGEVHYEYETVMPNVLNLRDIPESELEALKQLSGVVNVEMDDYHPYVLNLHDSTPLIRGLQSQVSAAGYPADGTGVRVCICDTGIDTDHLMYSDRIDSSAGYDFYNDDSNPEDDHGHGSHVAGIAVGGTGLSWDPCGTGSMPFQGVAPNATLIGVKILNQFGGGYDSDIIAGINYCADQSPSGGRADVINLSIGTGQYSGPCSHSWAVAANNAVANGVVVVAASGNENYSNALSSPACGADVMAVGMTWKADYPTCEDPTTNWNWGVCIDLAPQTDDVGCFSNESDYLDVTAPGANIWSASNAAGGASITGKSGTSMSSPQVAGLAALILDLDPSLTPAEVRQIIRDGAIDMGPPGFDRAYGYGRIDVLNSLALVGSGCTVPADCDDGLWCNGTEDCVGGSCVSGIAPDCSDGVACTDDSCNEGTDSCDNIPNDAYCDNSLFCDGTETCNATLGCQSGTAVDCNDGVACTDDTCNEGTDACDNIPNDAYCDNGLYCDGTETCNATLGCQSGTAVDCNDGVGCTDDFCNEASESCDNVANDAYCPDDGLFCNGTEYCDAVADCVSTGDPCGSGEVCNEGTDTCDPSACDGDGVCEAGEDCNTCPSDCISGGGAAFCGDGICQPSIGEDCLSCPDDCNGKQVGASKRQFCCGDGAGTNPVDCADSRCNQDVFSCSDAPADPYCCGDSACEGQEDSFNCAVDCGPAPYCGDGICDPGEDSCNCAADCGAPPSAEAACADGVDNDCDGLTDCADTVDCGADPACACLPKGEPCTLDSECCSNWCHRGACK